MKVKVYEGKDENKILEQVREEMGKDAVILNIKKIKLSGIFSMFRNERIEITAAVDTLPEKNPVEVPAKKAEPFIPLKPMHDKAQPLPEEKIINPTANNTKPVDYTKLMLEKELSEKDRIIIEKDNEIKYLKSEISKTELLLNQLTKDIIQFKNNSKTNLTEYENEFVQIVFNTLKEQNVMEPLARSFLKDFEDIGEDYKDVNHIVKTVYAKIIEILGEPVIIDILKRPNTVFFFGPTGVGKTTTIAKLASKFILENNINVGLMTADTFRIAAVEQLKTYAEILSIDVSVIYSKEDLEQSYNKMSKEKDIILVDTAGRSHKNDEGMTEINDLLEAVSNSEKYLVLSLATKSDDIIDIIKAYENLIDFRLIFTKSDETNNLGAIVNACYLTGKNISYITTGQIVPNDINIADPEKIAKSLLGMEVEV